MVVKKEDLMKAAQALVLAKTKERDYPRPGYLNMDNLKFKFGKKKKKKIWNYQMGNELKISLALFHSTAHHSKFLPLLLKGSFPGPFSTQDFAFSSYCEVKL